MPRASQFIIHMLGALALAFVPAWSHSADTPNILMLVAEDLSPRIGSFGDPVAQTPNIDKLASQGTRYTQVFTTAGVCAPSRAALISGQHQISFGGQHMRSSTGPLGPYLAQPPQGLKAFPELLRAAGYFTFTDTKLDYQFSGIRAGSGPFTIWDKDAAGDFDWREADPGQPFFGLINFMETHESGVMRPDGQPHSQTHRQTQKFRQQLNLVAPKVTRPEDVQLPPYYPDLPAVREDLARHYDNIAHMDARVGRILSALEEDGLLENTIIIWTTDHGDGLPRAKRELFDSGLLVPMVIRWPANFANTPAPGTSSDQLISFVDFAPTLLELAQQPQPNYLHGQSVFAAPRQYVFASRDRIDEISDRQRAIRDQRFKYIRSWHPEVPGGHKLNYRDNLDMVRAMRAAWQAGELNSHQSRWFEPTPKEQLYDVTRDPHELVNLVKDPDHQETLQRLRAALDQHLQRVGDWSEQSETQMRSNMLVEGEVPKTPPPELSTVHIAGKPMVRATSTVGASIGYQLEGESRWRLYTQAVGKVPGMSFKAVRYGWQESPPASPQ